MKDPIVEEVYEARAQLMRECGGSLKELIKRIRARESEHPELMVTPEEVRARKRQPKPKKQSKGRRAKVKS